MAYVAIYFEGCQAFLPKYSKIFFCMAENPGIQDESKDFSENSGPGANSTKKDKIGMAQFLEGRITESF
jgi:hypothetical protein